MEEAKTLELNQNNLEAYQIGLDDIDMFQGQLREKRVVIEQKFQEDNKELIDKIKILSGEAVGEKEGFRVQALELFKETKSKQLIGGLGIRVGIDLDYDDDEAMAWALDHKLCLTLNKTKFNSLAKKEDFKFVEKKEKITVTFPAKIKFENPLMPG